MSWQPTASLQTLQQAARLRHCIRHWMERQQLLEVVTPALSHASASDAHVHSIGTDDGRYLHTSPEFPMKRLLAAHVIEAGGKGPDLYQIATVFRADESGHRHNSQFTLLEWYRHGMDHVALMEDLTDMLRHVWQTFTRPWPGIEKRRYGLEVYRRLGVWPEQASTDCIARHFAATGRGFPPSIADDLDAALDLFIDEFVLPDFDADAFTLLIDYPVSQAALARLGRDEDGRAVAQRFELYFGSVELANGFHELSDAEGQRQRFQADLLHRDRLGTPRVPIDEHLLDALAAGLPDCAGIALGLERLHMVLGGHRHIRKVLSFDDQRA